MRHLLLSHLARDLRGVQNPGMFAKACTLMCLLACHASPPSITSGSGTGGTSSVAAPEPGAVSSPRQNNASANTSSPSPADSSPASANASPAPTGSSSAPPHAPANAPAKPGIGENCGAGDVCAPGMSCVSYYGFAGPRGPLFKSCEVRCEDNAACPQGRTCVTVSDGPGRVCR